MPQSTPTRVCAEIVYLIVTAVSGTAAVVLWLVDVDSRGVYAILAAITAGSFVGYLVRSVESRLLRRLERALDRGSYWTVYTDVMNDLGGVSGGRDR